MSEQLGVWSPRSKSHLGIVLPTDRSPAPRDFAEFKEAMDIIAPSFSAADLKAAFVAAVRRRSARTPGGRLAEQPACT